MEFMEAEPSTLSGSRFHLPSVFESDKNESDFIGIAGTESEPLSKLKYVTGQASLVTCDKSNVNTIKSKGKNSQSRWDIKYKLQKQNDENCELVSANNQKDSLDFEASGSIFSHCEKADPEAEVYSLNQPPGEGFHGQILQQTIHSEPNNRILRDQSNLCTSEICPPDDRNNSDEQYAQSECDLEDYIIQINCADPLETGCDSNGNNSLKKGADQSDIKSGLNIEDPDQNNQIKYGNIFSENSCGAVKDTDTKREYCSESLGCSGLQQISSNNISDVDISYQGSKESVPVLQSNIVGTEVIHMGHIIDPKVTNTCENTNSVDNIQCCDGFDQENQRQCTQASMDTGETGESDKNDMNILSTLLPMQSLQDGIPFSSDVLPPGDDDFTFEIFPKENTINTVLTDVNKTVVDVEPEIRSDDQSRRKRSLSESSSSSESSTSSSSSSSSSSSNSGSSSSSTSSSSSDNECDDINDDLVHGSPNHGHIDTIHSKGKSPNHEDGMKADVLCKGLVDYASDDETVPGNELRLVPSQGESAKSTKTSSSATRPVKLFLKADTLHNLEISYREQLQEKNTHKCSDQKQETASCKKDLSKSTNKNDQTESTDKSDLSKSTDKSGLIKSTDKSGLIKSTDKSDLSKSTDKSDPSKSTDKNKEKSESSERSNTNSSSKSKSQNSSYKCKDAHSSFRDSNRRLSESRPESNKYISKRSYSKSYKEDGHHRSSRHHSSDHKGYSRSSRSNNKHEDKSRYHSSLYKSRSSHSVKSPVKPSLSRGLQKLVDKMKNTNGARKIKFDDLGPIDSQSAGYCFVEFPDPGSANSALLRLNGKGVPGSKPHKLFKLNHASVGRQHLLVPEFSLYVGELTKDVDDLALYRAFASRYKSVRAAKVVIEPSGESKGFGFVRFTSEADQQLALIEMQGNTKLGEKPIRVSLAVAKNNRSMVAQPQPHSFQQQQAGTAYSQQYYQQYPPPHYYNTGPNWWQQYQEYYRGFPPPPATNPTPTSPTEQGPSYNTENTTKEEEYDEDDELLEDPEIEIDVDKANKEYFEKSDELYMAMEGSRWHPLDNIYSQIVPDEQAVAK